MSGFAQAALARLSSTDEAFLAIEDARHPMHVGSLLVFDGMPLVRDDRSLDHAAVHARIVAGVSAVERFRQKLAHVPGLGRAWVDDPHFDPRAHLAHAAVPRPGGEAQLFDLAGRALSPLLDRDRPLWDICTIEGLIGHRFAMLIRAHHAMVDGVAGIGALAAMLSTEPDPQPPRAPAAAPPRPSSAVEVAAHLAQDRARALGRAMHEVQTSFVMDRAAAWKHAAEVVSGLAHTLRDGLTPAPATSINPPLVSSRRCFAGARIDLGRAKAVRARLGGTLNDVILSTVVGALRRYLASRGDRVDELSGFRALVPVNLRPRTGDAAPMGNSVALVLAGLPLEMADARARHAEICGVTDRLKTGSHEIEGTALFERIGDVAAPQLVATVFHVAMSLRGFNVVITNVPGPPMPIYFGPSRLLEAYPVVPLFAHQGAGIAVLSYAGTLFFGVQSDAASVPDPGAIARALEASFGELEQIAGG